MTFVFHGFLLKPVLIKSFFKINYYFIKCGKNIVSTILALVYRVNIVFHTKYYVQLSVKPDIMDYGKPSHSCWVRQLLESYLIISLGREASFKEVCVVYTNQKPIYGKGQLRK